MLTTTRNAFVLNLQCFDTSYQSLDSVEWLGIFLTQTPGGFVGAGPTEPYIASPTEWHGGEVKRIYIPRHLGYADALEIDTQYTQAIGLYRPRETESLQVIAAGPGKLWDSSKDLFLVGGVCRFTGYLHLCAQYRNFPVFEFIVVCGRRHAGNSQAHHELEHWCLIAPESSEKWLTIFELIAESTRVADVASLDYLSKGIEHYGQQLSSSDSCVVSIPGTGNRVRADLSIERCKLGSLRSDFALVGECEANGIKIQFSDMEAL